MFSFICFSSQQDKFLSVAQLLLFWSGRINYFHRLSANWVDVTHLNSLNTEIEMPKIRIRASIL